MPYEIRWRQITKCNTNRDLDISFTVLTLQESFHFFPSARDEVNSTSAALLSVEMKRVAPTD